MSVPQICRWPLDAVIAGIQAGTSLVDAALVGTAATAAAVCEAASTGFGRRVGRTNGRLWIEVRGLDGPGGGELAHAVRNALHELPGVSAVSVSRPLSRVVVTTDDKGRRVSLSELCSALTKAEQRIDHRVKVAAGDDSAKASKDQVNLPGDGLLMAARGLLVGVNAAGFITATAGRALRVPPAPSVVEAAVSLAKYQPWLRGFIQGRIGSGRTHIVLSLASTAAHVVTLSPASLGVDLVTQLLKAAEEHAAAQVWNRYEPRLATDVDQPETHHYPRRVSPPSGPTDRYGKRAAFAQVASIGLTGLVTRDVAMTSNAALVAAPKAVRTTTEAFAATLGKGLAGRHDVLALQPGSLRRLDTIDVILIDPRVLLSPELRVASVRGAEADQVAIAWDRAAKLADKAELCPGWHRVPRMPVRASGEKPVVEALIAPAHHPLASAVLAEARVAGVELVSIDVAALGELRTAFDDLHPVSADGEAGIDAGLVEMLTALQAAGRTVAVLSATGYAALAGADVGLGIMADGAADLAPPCGADLLAADLAGAWQLLHALPAARQASQRGITIAASASALGAVLMVPGARRGGGRGPGPVTVGAAAGLLSGYLLARRTLRTSAPKPAPTHEWHAMSVRRVRELLPQPDLDAAATHPAGDRPVNPIWAFAKAVRAELADPLTPIMVVGSAATAILGSPIDAIMVGTVLTGNAMLAAAQQLRAESRLGALLAKQTPPARRATVRPDGSHAYSEVVAERLQPGELIEVRSNEVVPADARIVEARDLEVDESALTGESLTVVKQAAATPEAELAERRCMIYAGTTVVAGTAVALVTATGAETQARRAAELTSGDPRVVGLQSQLGQLMYRAFPVSAGGGALVAALGLLRRGPLRQALGDAIGVAVAAVPEGMPLMATLAQYASARRLSTAGALVRVPRAVEALGRIDVVCFDKTGTLSQNQLRVTRVHPVFEHSDEDVLRCAAHAAPETFEAARAHATDQAILEAATSAADRLNPRRRDAYLPFRSGRAFSAAVSGRTLTTKGAPEVLLAACRNVPADAPKTVAELASRGLRVIAVAQRSLTDKQARLVREDADSLTTMCGAGLSLVGFLGLADTPRPQAAQLLTDLAQRGVAVRLITGDHPTTATAIAGELGLTVTASQVITGSEWNALSRKEQEQAVGKRVLFARMSPENKVQIVQTLQRCGRICAMVGDGANDAAAIRAATVGIGVVARGSDSAHTIADVVLTNGRITGLIDAVDEGRRLWRGVQAAVTGLLGGNAGEVAFAVIGAALTGASPLNTRQLLLMNALTDALPATAVAISTPSGPVHQAQHSIDERILWRAVALRGMITAGAATAAWALASITGRRQRAATVALITLVSVELAQAPIDSHAPLVWWTSAVSFALFAAVVSIPGISQLLGCTPVGPVGWGQALAAAAAATAAVAVLNFRTRRRGLPADGPVIEPHAHNAQEAATPKKLALVRE